jgi:hypothetical protein
MTVEVPAQQHDSEVDVAGENAPASADENGSPAGESGNDTGDEADNTDQDDDQDDDDQSGSARERRYRLRLRQAERERDELRDTLDRTRQSIVDNAVNAAGVDPRLMVAAGHTVDTLVGDDGLIDAERLSQAITHTAAEFRVTPKGRPPAPNVQQGHGSQPPASKSSWSGALKGK